MSHLSLFDLVMLLSTEFGVCFTPCVVPPPPPLSSWGLVLGSAGHAPSQSRQSRGRCGQKAQGHLGQHGGHPVGREGQVKLGGPRSWMPAEDAACTVDSGFLRAEVPAQAWHGLLISGWPAAHPGLLQAVSPTYEGGPPALSTHFPSSAFSVAVLATSSPQHPLAQNWTG